MHFLCVNSNSPGKFDLLQDKKFPLNTENFEPPFTFQTQKNQPPPSLRWLEAINFGKLNTIIITMITNFRVTLLMYYPNNLICAEYFIYYL